MLDWVGATGAGVVGLFRYVGSLGSLAAAAAGSFALTPLRGSRVVYQVTLAQLYFTGVQALPFIAIMGLALGLSIAFLVPSAALTGILVAAQVRELCPLFAAFIVLGRSGTAVAVELGGMVLRGEIDYLQASGVDPLRFIVFPRLVGGVLATLALTVHFNLFAALGVALGSQQSILLTVQDLLSRLAIRDLGISLLKGALFGFIIALVSCHHGLSIQPYSTEVPKGAIRSVMAGFLFFSVVNAALIPIYA
jgi:phospholipid/cholesterol/gamma-HCH transport system permease protein